MSHTRTIEEQDYVAFVCSIYSTYESADEETRAKIREQIKGQIGNFYFPFFSDRERKANNTLFIPEMTEDNKLTISHGAIGHAEGTGSFEFGANKAVIKTVKHTAFAICHTIITIENNEITVETFNDDKPENKTVTKGETTELKKFLDDCMLHTIPELATPFLDRSAQQAAVEKELYPPLSSFPDVVRSTQDELHARLGLPQPPVPQYEPYQSPEPQYQPYQPPVVPQYQPPTYMSKRYDENKEDTALSVADQKELDMYMSSHEVEKNEYFNTGKGKGNEYKRYADIDCIDLPEAKKKPSIFTRMFYTKVQIDQGELGLVIHKGKEEIIAPGTYYFFRSTVLDKTKGKDGKVKASDPLIEHGRIKIVTVPRGHLEHAFVPDERSPDKVKRILMRPGRYNIDNHADQVSSVVNPYGVETSLKNDKTVFKTIVPDGKAGFGKIKKSEDSKAFGSDVMTYPSGKNIIDTETEIFEGRVSTKIQTVILKQITVTLKDGTEAIVDATVSYQIPDDTHLYKQKSSIQKVVEACGRTENGIKNKIEGPEGLAQHMVQEECAKKVISQLLQDNKILINTPETDLNVPENTEYQGVKFLSVSFNNISFDKKHAEELATTAIQEIEKSLTELDDKESAAYLTIQNDILCDLDLVPKSESKGEPIKASVPRLDIKDIDGQIKIRQEQKSDESFVFSQSHLFTPGESADHFKRQETIVRSVNDGNYEYHTTDGSRSIFVPCVSESYLSSFAARLTWLPDWITGNTSIKIEQDEIGLIRINGKPEFLKPGTYYLSSSIEWVRKEKIKSDEGKKVIIQHDSIMVANIPKGDRLYVEDNTLYKRDGSVKDYLLLDEGVHIIDSPTLTYRELVPYQNALMVKRSEDEKSRIKAGELEFCLDSFPQIPDKRKVYLYPHPQKKCISYTLQDKSGVRVDGDLAIKAPLEWGPETVRKLEIQIRQALASAQQITYIPEQDKNNKVLAVKINPKEAGVFYNEKGDICICGPGEFEIKDEWTFYSRIELEGKRDILVEAYTADNIRVKVKTTVDYKLPIQSLEKAIRAGGVNKIVNEIERLATEAVVRQIRSLNYIAAAKITYTESQEFQASFSNLTREAAQKALRADLENLEDSGIAITNVTLVDKIEPTDPKVKRELFKILSKKAEIREAIRDKFQAELQEKVRERVAAQYTAAAELGRSRVNDHVSASQLPHRSVLVNQQPAPANSQQQKEYQQYQPYRPLSSGGGQK